jgi:PAS domain-containing protein
MVELSLEFEELKEFLKSHPNGITIKELSQELSLNRNSVAKYLEILLVSGQVEKRTIGPAKLYSLTNRVPISQLANFSNECIVLIDEHSRILFGNKTFYDHLQIPEKELLGNTLFSIDFSLFNHKDFVEDFSRVSDKQKIERTVCILNSSYLRYYSYSIVHCCFENAKCGYAIVFSDITKQKEYEHFLKYRTKFEEILAEIASDFILVKKDEIDTLLQKSFEKIGKFTQVDRMYLYLFNKKNEMFLEKYWLNQNTPKIPKELNGINMEKKFPFWFKKLKQFEYLFIHKHTLPENAISEREYMEKNSIQSFITAPLIYEGNLIGMFGFTMINESRIWSEDMVSLLGILGRMYVQVLKKEGTLEKYLE